MILNCTVGPLPGGRRLTDKEMKDYGYQQQRAEVYCPQPRARVQIEYDVEFTAREKIELPFVMAVLADLAGKPRESCHRSPIVNSLILISITSTSG